MGKGNFALDFRPDAIKQIAERGHSLADVQTAQCNANGWII